MGRAVTFKGAADIPDCGGMVRFGASLNVKVGGIGVSRGGTTAVSGDGDLNTPHAAFVLDCGPHATAITVGSLKVRVNGKGCGRMGDDVGGGACTAVAEGHPKVFAG
jgi:uncharacterized Zn-binding protein involved in type VI secretion